MEWSEIWLPVLAATLLRIGIPLALTLAAAWGLRRLDARWQREAERARAESQGPSPFDLIKCWLVNECPPAKREQCSAYLEHGVPCWQQRRDERGRLAEGCLRCPVFRRGFAVEAI